MPVLTFYVLLFGGGQRFLDGVSRPLVSKAFYTWKWSNRSANQDTHSLFTEGNLPWCIRHPRSLRTFVWDLAQIPILIYIAFSAIHQITFNRTSDGAAYMIEIFGAHSSSSVSYEYCGH
jgi:hypothetical protein